MPLWQQQDSNPAQPEKPASAISLLPLGYTKKSPPKNYFQRSTWIRIEECAVAVLDVGLVELDGAEPVLVEVQSGLE